MPLHLSWLERALTEQGKTQADVKNAVDAADKQRKTFLEDEDIPSDKKIMAATAMMYYTDIDKNQQPIGFYQGIKEKFGSLDDEATYKAWANSVFQQYHDFGFGKMGCICCQPRCSYFTK